MATATQPAAEKRLTPRFALTQRELGQYGLARAIMTSAGNQEGSERRARQSDRLNFCVDVTGSPRKSLICAIILAWMSGSNGYLAGTLRPHK